MVDRDGLENRCTLTGTQGSNPCLSANDKKGCESIDAQPFVVRKGGMRILGSLSRSAFAAQRRKNPCLSANDKKAASQTTRGLLL